MADNSGDLSAAQVSALLTQQESDTLEFKLDTEKVGDLAETLMALANASGGMVLIGVDDSGAVIGVSHPKQIRDRLYAAARLVTPPLADVIQVQAVTLADSIIIIAIVPGNLRNTYAVSGLYRRRLGSYNVALAPDELAALLSRRGQVAVDLWPVPGATLDDLDPARIDIWLRRRCRLLAGQPLPPPWDNLSLEQRLHRLNLLAEAHPTVGALLMFGREPQRLVAHSEVQCARFAGVTPSNFLDREYLTGPLPDLIDGALQFIQRNTRHALEIGAAVAEEVAEYPFVAVREAVTNAVTHREYVTAHAAVRVLIFDDRIEIISPGGLLPGLSVEQLLGQTALRNRAVAELLHIAGYIEKFGTGIARMSEALVAAGLPPPMFTNSETAFKVTLIGPGSGFRRSARRPATPHSLADAPLDLPATVVARLNPQQLQGYRVAWKAGRITAQEYCVITGRSRPAAKRDLATLVALGVFDMHSGGPSTYYTVTPGPVAKYD